ncbi:MAG TPA: SAM-dependent chlorinase/fluorinase [Myxococcota bacterium]|nr:SAM-dependent chlorinase/fluorinase [Myxococcota bacterium]
MKRARRVGSPSGIVTLTTDFGGSDGYVGAVKGVILARFRKAQLVDLAHDLAPGDVRAASDVLARATPLFPPRSVHLAVVDPGVGTARRGLALLHGGQLYVGPDNGIFAGVLAQPGAPLVWALENWGLWRDAVSPVFHGRDVFGPVAAHLAGGGDPRDVGPAVEPASLARLELAVAVSRGDALEGEVVHVDRFGNLITNLTAPEAAGAASVELAGRRLPLSRTYGDAAPGALVALVGSSGKIEIAANGASAAAALGAGAGLVVILRAPRESA